MGRAGKQLPGPFAAGKPPLAGLTHGTACTETAVAGREQQQHGFSSRLGNTPAPAANNLTYVHVPKTKNGAEEVTLHGSRASIFRCTFIHGQTTGSVELGFTKLWQLRAKTSSEIIPSSALSLAANKINPKGYHDEASSLLNH